MGNSRVTKQCQKSINLVPNSDC